MPETSPNPENTKYGTFTFQCLEVRCDTNLGQPSQHFLTVKKVAGGVERALDGRNKFIDQNKETLESLLYQDSVHSHTHFSKHEPCIRLVLSQVEKYLHGI